MDRLSFFIKKRKNGPLRVPFIRRLPRQRPRDKHSLVHAPRQRQGFAIIFSPEYVITHKNAAEFDTIPVCCI